MRIEDKEGIAVRPVTTEDVTEIAAVTARAFEDDPLFEWLLPDHKTRIARATAAYEALFAGFLNVDFAELYTTTDCAGIAIWAGPENWDPPATALLPRIPRLMRVLGMRGFVKLMRAMGEVKKVHPSEPHWYLAGLATDPPKQRTGVGGALVNHVLERCDREGLGAYLETQKAANVPYYERFGFCVAGELDLPSGGPHIWLMWRDPL